MSNDLATALRELRDCFESAMDLRTALGCAGFEGASAEEVRIARSAWREWAAKFEASQRAW